MQVSTPLIKFLQSNLQKSMYLLASSSVKQTTLKSNFQTVFSGPVNLKITTTVRNQYSKSPQPATTRSKCVCSVQADKPWTCFAGACFIRESLLFYASDARAVVGLARVKLFRRRFRQMAGRAGCARVVSPLSPVP